MKINREHEIELLTKEIEADESQYIEVGKQIRSKQLRLAELEGRSDVEPEINKCSQCGADTHLKGEAVISCGAAIDKLLRSIQQSVKRYHLALDQRQHGAVAADKLVNEVHEALGMVYEPGTTLKLLNERPDLIKYYTCSKEDKL